MLGYFKVMEDIVVDKLKKAEQIAKDTQAKMDESKALEAKQESESKEAVKIEKTKGSKSIVDDAEKKAENDARVLSAKDEELSKEDKGHKAELLKAKEEKDNKAKKEETIDDKLKRTKEETQKRIDEVIGELKAQKAESQQDKEKIAGMEAELADLKKPKAEETKAGKVKQLFNDRIATYLEEDKAKPRDERREMPKDELEQWLIDDYIEASDWMTDRNIRRNQEKKSIVTDIDEAPKRLADDFVSKQQESLKKLVAKYPDVMPSKEKLAELKGKSKDEIDQVLASENEEYKVMLEIVKSNPKKYLEAIDGPEQVMVEMDRRKPAKNTITLTQEELQQKITEAATVEAQRLASLDEGLSSSGSGKKMGNAEKKSETRLKQEEIAKKAGISIENLNAAIDRRETIPGASVKQTAESFKED